MQYRIADVLDPPAEWRHAFDLVVEIITVQALPPSHQLRAIASIGGLVAVGGTLLVISGIDDGQPRTRLSQPHALDPAGIASFAVDGLVPRTIEVRAVPGRPELRRWFAQFTRKPAEGRAARSVAEPHARLRGPEPDEA